MTVPEGVISGVVGNILYQLLIVNKFRGAKKIWPWQDTQANTTFPYFLFSFTLRASAAGIIVYFFMVTRQIDGQWGAAIIGMAADQIAITAGDAARKEHDQ